MTRKIKAIVGAIRIVVAFSRFFLLDGFVMLTPAIFLPLSSYYIGLVNSRRVKEDANIQEGRKEEKRIFSRLFLHILQKRLIESAPLNAWASRNRKDYLFSGWFDVAFP
jgi:hypothetical protein